jgi:hypothetical protein
MTRWQITRVLFALWCAAMAGTFRDRRLLAEGLMPIVERMIRAAQNRIGRKAA